MTTHQNKEGLIERICHQEQIGIWANELLSALSLSDFLREDWSYDDSVDAEREIIAQLRDIIGSALTHPEFDIVAELSSLREENGRLRKERDEARALVAEANNSLYGSQGYFHSLNGGPFDKWHLANGIETLKEASRKASASQAQLKIYREALERVADIMRRNFGRQNEKLADIEQIARTALSQEAGK